MPKQKGKKSGGKKKEPEEILPPKTIIHKLFETGNLKAGTLSLAQQKFIISSLGLSDNCLYDSLIIDIFTNFLRFCQKIQIDPTYTHKIYNILQNTIYKLIHDEDFDENRLGHYFRKELNKLSSSQLPSTLENEDPNKSVDVITKEQSKSIMSFIEESFIAQYRLYRGALFKKNPAYNQYQQFQKEYSVGDLVRFEAKEDLWQLEEFRENDICLKHINNASDVGGDSEPALRTYVSREQIKYITFVGKPEEVIKDEKDVKEVENVENVHEEKEKDVEDEQVKEQDIEKEQEREQEKVVVAEDEEMTKKEEKIEEANKTLIDVIVDKKVEDRLKEMREKYEKEINGYKNQIKELKENENGGI